MTPVPDAIVKFVSCCFFLLLFLLCCSQMSSIYFRPLSLCSVRLPYHRSAQKKNRPFVGRWPEICFSFASGRGGGGAAHSTLIVCVFVCGWELVWQGSRVYFPIFFYSHLKIAHTSSCTVHDRMGDGVCVFVWWCDLRLLFEVKINSLKVVLRLGAMGGNIGVRKVRCN